MLNNSQYFQVREFCEHIFGEFHIVEVQVPDQLKRGWCSEEPQLASINGALLQREQPW